jgi:hypothetical protein
MRALIPRPAASAAVARLISSLAAGQGGLLAVTGPPGSGRTALAEEAVTLAARHGFPVRRKPAPSDGTATLVVLDGPAVPDRALVERLASDRTAVLVTADRSLGLDPEVRLGGFPEPALAGWLDLPPDAVHAVWPASGGLPGPARALADGLPLDRVAGRVDRGQDTADGVADHDRCLGAGSRVEPVGHRGGVERRQSGR